MNDPVQSPASTAEATRPESIIDFQQQTTGCRSEDEVIRALLRYALSRGFPVSRVYDAHFCPIRQRSFVVLRASSDPDQEARMRGYLIEHPSYDTGSANPQGVYFERWDSHSVAGDPNKLKWVADLELAGFGWYDIPIVDGDEMVGLWAVAKENLDPPESRELELLSAVALCAGTRISHIRDKEARVVSDQLLASSDTSSFNDAVVQSLQRIARILDAAFVAYFRFEPSTERLQRVAEVYWDAAGDTCSMFEGVGDESYLPGESVTGRAWLSDQFHVLADFPGFCAAAGITAEEQSERSHRERHGRPIRSVLYTRIQRPGGTTGLLRVMNRAASPDLLFSSYHARTLNHLSVPFSHVVAAGLTTSLFDTLWEGFLKTIAQVRDSGMAFRGLSLVTGRLHVLETVVSVWAEKGGLIEAWKWTGQSEPKGLHRGDVPLFNERDLPSGIAYTRALPAPLASMVSDAAALVLVVPYRESRPNADKGELVVTVFVLASAKDGNDHVDANVYAHWFGDIHARKTLELIGRLLGLVHELSRNRDLLRLAEEAIGFIGHEARSPLSELRGVQTELLRVVDPALRAMNEGLPFNVRTLGVSGADAERDITLDSMAGVLQWLRDADRKLDEDYRRISRVVSDSIRWARLGGRSIEVHFELVSLKDLIGRARSELRDEFAARPWLRLTISESVAKLQRFVGDPVLLQVLVTNLLDNAVKYSHHRDPSNRRGVVSEIKIHVERQTNLIDIAISNWGLGISRHDYDNIFSSFYRSAVRDRLHTIRGVGLGLPTCKKIVTAHGGSIKVNSTPTLSDPLKVEAMEGYETTFVVRLPLDLLPGRHDINLDSLSQRGRLT